MTTSNGELAIDLHNVVKFYRKRVHALRGIELRVRPGEVFGLLGPNGAGKSTLVKIMMTVVRPTRAQGTVLGRPIGHKPTLASIGYLPENHRFPRYLTGRQVLEFFAALSNVDRPRRKRRAGELLELVGMTEAADRKISTYSKGMLQRIGLANALVHEPDLVVLDEPTDGVDPVGRRDILQVLAQLGRQGKTIFVNSHALSELESICQRVAILIKGQVALQGTIDELTIAKQRYEIELAAQEPAALRQRIIAALPAQWKAVPPTASQLEAASAVAHVNPAGPPPLGYAGASRIGVAQVRVLDRGMLDGNLAVELEGAVLRLGTMEPQQVQGVIDAVRRAGLTIRRVQQVRPSLEDLFMDTVSDARGNGAAAARAALTGGRHA